MRRSVAGGTFARDRQGEDPDHARAPGGLDQGGDFYQRVQ
jgi:hypothetical protein